MQASFSRETRLKTGVGNWGRSVNIWWWLVFAPRGMQSASVCIICNQSCWRQVCLGSRQWPFPIPGDKCSSPFWNQQKSGQRKMPLLFCQVCKKGCGTMTPLSQGEKRLPRRTGFAGIGWGLGRSWWGMRARSMRPTAGVGSGGGKGLVHETSSRRARREWNYCLRSRCGALKEEKYHCDLSCWNQRNLFFGMHSECCEPGYTHACIDQLQWLSSG